MEFYLLPLTYNIPYFVNLGKGLIHCLPLLSGTVIVLVEVNIKTILLQ